MKKLTKAHLRKMQEGRRRARLASIGAVHDQQEIPERVLAYALGRIEGWIEVYAQSHRVSATTLANRVGHLLRASSGR